ncbi:unnamed protein product [Penicillium pancosmium]
MATYQGILLQLIFAVLVAKKDTTFDLSLRFQLPAQEYELLSSLVETCRLAGLFYYPNMISRHHSSAPLALVWVSVEEIKRFGLALYKLCRLCSRSGGDTIDGNGNMEFRMPDSDEIWNAPEDEFIRLTALQQPSKDNRDTEQWISKTSGQLYDGRVGFDWI